ncbi:MAG: BMP family ABC transporter substrate-binding protein [Spirochaetaceae bacterium]|nr:BMP family ABC transporter substrate-binding protein [Spirochaetaceae bacterium]
MKKISSLFSKLFILVCCCFILFSCSKDSKSDSVSVAVFVPGIMADSPVYAMLAQGVEEGIDEFNSNITEGDLVSVTILEAGTNQSEWPGKITALAATGKYDVIISSNPSLPDIVEPLTKQFPKQKFIILDAFYENNENIATVRYNQREQSYLTGYIAALVSSAKDEMKYSNAENKIGLIAAQEYPVMNNIIYPGFVEGAQEAVPGTTVDFRIVGNWYDATKGAELAKSMYKNGIDVILPICGGASQGVIAAAKEMGFYITWFDNNGFSKAPGYIVSSSVMAQKRMAKEITMDYLNNLTEFGSAKTVGIREGYIDFIQDDPEYIKIIPEDIRKKMETVVSSIKDGSLLLPSL